MRKNGTTTFESRLDSLKEGVRNLVDAGGERAGHLKDRAMDAKDTAFENSRAAVSRVGEMIRMHPFAAIGIAFGIGYITVRLMRR